MSRTNSRILFGAIVVNLTGHGSTARTSEWKEAGLLTRRGDYGGLALVFAELAGCHAVWKVALKGWNMVQSQQVLEWMAEGEAKGETRAKVADLLRLLELRFQVIAPDIQANIRATDDLATLSRWFDAAATAAALADFRQTTGL